MVGESIDVPMTLDGNQDALIDAVAAANPQTGVVLETNAGVAMPWAGRVPAIVEAWYPGHEPAARPSPTCCPGASTRPAICR